jgi:hypothetical protein
MGTGGSPTLKTPEIGTLDQAQGTNLEIFLKLNSETTVTNTPLRWSRVFLYKALA